MSKKDLQDENKLSVFIVEDHPIFRDGLTQLINKEDDIIVCGEADNAEDAVKLIRKKSPDLVVVDIMLKESCGIELTKRLTKKYMNMPVLVLSMHDESVYMDRVLRAGARGYIDKRETTSRVVEAIRHVSAGRVYVSDNMVENIINRYIHNPGETSSSPLEVLSEREFEVFNLIGQGIPNRVIADQLSVSSKTVSTYRERIKSKLNLKTSSELTRYAMKSVENN